MKLTPVFTQTSEKKIHSEPQFSQSDDEQNAIRQLDDILQQQRSSNGSLDDSEPSEAELPEKDHNSIKMLTNNQNDILLSTEAYNFSENAQLMKSFIDEASFNRTRSQTYDSQVSNAESRFGGFDLCDENGNSNVSLIF